MFLNKKTNYIFVSFGDEINNLQESWHKSFFKRFFKTKPKNRINQIKENHVFELTKKLISDISKFTEKKCYSFYLNLEDTHDQFIDEITTSDAERFYIFPLYPQYRSDLHSIANFFSLNLYDEITNKFFWVKSFHNNDFFIEALQKNIKTLMKKDNLDEKTTFFLFLANEQESCPLYSLECEITCQNVIKAFQFVEGSLLFFNENYQSSIESLISNGRQDYIIIPITTLIDDVTTQNKIKIIQSFLEKQNKNVFTCKTLNHNLYFVRSILGIIEEKSFVSNKMISSF